MVTGIEAFAALRRLKMKADPQVSGTNQDADLVARYIRDLEEQQCVHG